MNKLLCSFFCIWFYLEKQINKWYKDAMCTPPHENKSNTANRNLDYFFLSLPSCSLPLSGAQNPVKTGRLPSGCTAGGQGLQSARRLLPSCSVLLAAALASTSPFTPVSPQSSMAFPPFLLCSKKKRKKTCGLNVCIEMSPRVLITWTLL